MDFISNLPETLLIEIFKNCKRILPLCYVCKRFNKIISTSAPLMNRLKLVITSGSLNRIEESERIHRNAFIKFDYQIDERHYQLMTRFQELRSIEFVRCIIQADAFFKILENIPNLKSLYIVSTFLRSVEFNDVIPPRAENLKIISLRNSDELFLRFFSNSMSIEFVHLAFQKTCSIVAVQDFFETHKNTIKVIDRLSIPSIDLSLLFTVLNDMNIERLNIELDRIELSTLTDLRDTENKTIHHLSLYGSGDINLMLCFFKKLRHLEIEMNSEMTPENLIQATQIHSELESLIVMDCTGIETTDSLLQISLRNLKRLKSGFKFSVNGWREFARRNPNIVNFKLLDSITDGEFQSICLNFHQLQRLELMFDHPSMTTLTLDFICSDNFPKNIRFIEITREVDSQWRNFVLTENHLNHLKKVNLILKLK